MKDSSVPLGGLVTISGGGTPNRNNDSYWGGSIPWASVKDLKDTTLSGTQETITPEGLRDSASNLIPAGSVIVATRMGLGKVAINTVDVTINQDLKAFSCGVDLEPRYLLYFLLANASHLDSMGKGATVKGITLDVLKDLSVPLPPLPEQKRIAAILDKADSIRRKRQEAVRLTEELLRSVFLDMFGDPVTNPKGWEKAAIKEFGNVMTGNTPSREKPEYYGEGIEWIKSDNINTPYHYLTEAREYLSVEGQRVGRFVPSGSILVTCIAGSPECIGNAALSNREVAFNQQINAISPFNGSDSFFLYSQILVAKKLIQMQSTESMKGIVSKGKFENILLIKPPIELQRQFGVMFRRVEALSKKNDTASNHSEAIFKTLLQRAFEGEFSSRNEQNFNH